MTQTTLACRGCGVEGIGVVLTAGQAFCPLRFFASLFCIKTGFCRGLFPNDDLTIVFLLHLGYAIGK